MKNINFCLLQFIIIFAMFITCIVHLKANNTPKVDVSTLHGAGNKPSIVGVFYFIMKTKICGIYKITSPSHKIYIGQSKDVKDRWNAYKRLDCKSQNRLYNSFLKHGTDRHKFEIVEQCLESELNEREKYYVDLFQTFNSEYGMNLKDGGGHNVRYSEETRRKMSILAKERNPMTQEARNKMSKSHKGMKMSEECKRKMSKSHKKRVQSAPLVWRTRAIKNGIGTRGENHYNAKLTAQQVIEMRTRYWNLKQANIFPNVLRLMKEYKTSRTNFYGIINKKRWKHIEIKHTDM